MKSIRRVDEWGNIHYTNENGEHHRLDGPAFESPNGYKSWLINGKFHREDGPSRIFTNGSTRYHLNGIEYTKEDWELEITKIKLERIKNL